METLTILVLICVVMAVLAAGRFKHPPTKFQVEESDEFWRWPLPDMTGTVVVMGEDELEETDNIVMPDLWFYRRKDKAFHEARKWLDDGKLWWRPFEPVNVYGVKGEVQGDEYIEIRENGRSRRLVYVETVETTDEICRMANFQLLKIENGWRCYGTL